MSLITVFLRQSIFYVSWPISCCCFVMAHSQSQCVRLPFFVRLVLIADKKKVLTQFPIPLINRLEKHYVSATSLLTDWQKQLKIDLEEWATRFVTPARSQHHGQACILHNHADTTCYFKQYLSRLCVSIGTTCEIQHMHVYMNVCMYECAFVCICIQVSNISNTQSLTPNELMF